MRVETKNIPYKGFQDSRGFWIPYKWNWEISQITIVSGIPGCLSCIPDSTSKNFTDSGIPYMGHQKRFLDFIILILIFLPMQWCCSSAQYSSTGQSSLGDSCQWFGDVAHPFPVRGVGPVWPDFELWDHGNAPALSAVLPRRVLFSHHKPWATCSVSTSPKVPQTWRDCAQEIRAE